MPKGRDKSLIEKRNAKLAQRWYYWTETQRLRFDDALKILSQQEFFLSEDRIMTILRGYIKEHPQTKMTTHIKIKAPRLTAEQLSLFPDL